MLQARGGRAPEGWGGGGSRVSGALGPLCPGGCASLSAGPVCLCWEVFQCGLLLPFMETWVSPQRICRVWKAVLSQASARLRCPERCQLAVPLSPFGLQSGTSHEGHLLWGEGSLCLQRLLSSDAKGWAPQMAGGSTQRLARPERTEADRPCVNHSLPTRPAMPSPGGGNGDFLGTASV